MLSAAKCRGAKWKY